MRIPVTLRPSTTLAKWNSTSPVMMASQRRRECSRNILKGSSGFFSTITKEPSTGDGIILSITLQWSLILETTLYWTILAVKWQLTALKLTLIVRPTHWLILPSSSYQLSFHLRVSTFCLITIANLSKESWAMFSQTTSTLISTGGLYHGKLPAWFHLSTKINWSVKNLESWGLPLIRQMKLKEIPSASPTKATPMTARSNRQPAKSLPSKAL